MNTDPNSSSHPTHLPTNQLQSNPFQPRGRFSAESISELKQSIAIYGILEPLVVAETPAGYQIIAGERRWRAARELGLAEVPVWVKKTTPRGMLEMAIVENVQRVDLSAIERAQAFQQLMRDFQFTPKQVADRVGKSASYVSNTIRLLALPDAVKDGLVGQLITEGHARALSGLGEDKHIIECYKTVLRKNASVRETEELVRLYKHREELGTEEKRGRNRNLQVVDTTQWVKQISRAFQAKTKVKLSRSSAQTRVTITLVGSPDETQSDLEKILALGESSQ